ncbi:MAG: LamG domain-containing protein [Planctomycetes bacterium]|nr:LamG domain-containing protein [Planctomycetota bacterium]
MRTIACSLLPLIAGAVSAQDTGVSFVNGVDAFLELPYSAQFIPQSGFTVEAWVTYDDSTILSNSGNRYPTIARQHVSGGGNEAWFLRVNAGGNNTLQLRFRASTTGGNIIVNYNFSPGQFATWTHVAATADATAVTLYVNGATVASLPGNGLPLRDMGGELRVGKGATLAGGVANEVWNGDIDELRIWPFARTAAEIQASMNEKLQAVPGLVATWNFDNTLVDTSTGNVLVANGAVGFTANTLMLGTPSAGTALGASSAGCLGDILLSPTGAPTSGNAAFGVAGSRLPASAFAFFATAFAAAPAPLPIAGIDYWLDPGSTIAVFTQADALGLVRFALPMPASGFTGVNLAFQVAALDACGSQGLTASNAMAITIQ